MADKNTLEKITFVKLYDAALRAGELTRTKPGTLGNMVRESSTVFAGFVASYCAEQLMLLIERTAHDRLGLGADWMPDKQIETIGGLTVTGAVDYIYEKAREWQAEVHEIVLGHTDATPEQFDPQAVIEAVVDQVNAGALGPDVTASMSPALGTRGPLE